jgi:hypothetical protein
LGFFVIILLLLDICRYNNKFWIWKKHRNFEILMQH